MKTNLKPNILAIGNVQYSVSVMGVWKTTDTDNVYHVFHLVVRARGVQDAIQVACERVKEHTISTGMFDGLTTLSAICVTPGRHPNLVDGVQPVADEDDGMPEAPENEDDAGDEV